MSTCYRHPSRETGVSCSNCGNPICTDCMTATPVGMRCPDCASQRTPVRTLSSLTTDPTATYVLIAINVLLLVGQTASGSAFATGSQGSVGRDLALFGPAVAAGEYWRLITGGFLHGGILHLAFNMYALWWLGQVLEPALGRARYLALYFTSLLAGSFGALLLQPNAITVGASGAVFGLMAAAFVFQRVRGGVDPMAGGIGPVLLLNLGITFLIPGISIGGHLGGLAGGAVAALAIERLGQRRGVPTTVALLACAAVAALAVAGAIAVADGQLVT